MSEGLIGRQVMTNGRRRTVMAVAREAGRWWVLLEGDGGRLETTLADEIELKAARTPPSLTAARTPPPKGE